MHSQHSVILSHNIAELSKAPPYKSMSMASIKISNNGAEGE